MAAAALVAALAGVAGSASQDSGSDTTFRTAVERVVAPVVVRDSSGASVGGLRRQNFRIYDEGKQRPITELSVELRVARLES